MTYPIYNIWDDIAPTPEEEAQGVRDALPARGLKAGDAQRLRMDELKRGLALVRYHAEKCEENAARCDWWKSSPMMQQRAEALRADARALQAVARAVRDALERLVNEARAALAAAPREREGEGSVDHAHTDRRRR